MTDGSLLRRSDSVWVHYRLVETGKIFRCALTLILAINVLIDIHLWLDQFVPACPDIPLDLHQFQ